MGHGEWKWFVGRWEAWGWSPIEKITAHVISNWALQQKTHVLGGLLVVPEYTLLQSDEYLEEAATEGEKEEEKEKGRRRKQ